MGRTVGVNWVGGMLAIVLVHGCAMALSACQSNDRLPSEATNKEATGLPHDMSMGQELNRDFAHRDLIVLKQPAETSYAFRIGLANLYHRYLALHKAFTANDATRIDEIASEMRFSAESLETGTPTQAANTAWKGHRQVMTTSLHQLSESESLQDKRVHFSHVSEAMYCALKSFGGVEHKVYVFYCPLGVAARGAYWLSSREQIHAPYREEEYPACGEVRETIPGFPAYRSPHSPRLD